MRYRLLIVCLVITLLKHYKVNAEGNSLEDQTVYQEHYDCSQPVKIGRCRASFRRYFFNQSSENCELFFYGGCRGNGNRFLTIEKCQEVCMGIEMGKEAAAMEMKMAETLLNIESLASIQPEMLTAENPTGESEIYGEDSDVVGTEDVDLDDGLADYLVVDDEGLVQSIAEETEVLSEPDVNEETENDAQTEDIPLTVVSAADEGIEEHMLISNTSRLGDKCPSFNPCLDSDFCIWYEDKQECGCGSESECIKPDTSPLTLKGDTFIQHIFHHNPFQLVPFNGTRIGISFSTREENGSLFYAHYKETHMHIFIQDGRISIEINSEITTEDEMSGETHTFTDDKVVNDGEPHALRVNQSNGIMSVVIDGELEEQEMQANSLVFSPSITFGGGENSESSNFKGCLLEVYMNHRNILYFVQQEGRGTTLFGDVTPRWGECDLDQSFDVIDIGVGPGYHIPVMYEALGLKLRFDFMIAGETEAATMVTIPIVTDTGKNVDLEIVWGILDQEERRKRREADAMYAIEIYAATQEERRLLMQITSDTLAPNTWQDIDLFYEGDMIAVKVGPTYPRTYETQYEIFALLRDDIYFGKSASMEGVSMSFRNVRINDGPVPATSFIPNDIETMRGKPQKMEPPPAMTCSDAPCLHGGLCSDTDDGFECDCKDTGYTGKTCGFADFRSSCENLRRLGITKNGIYIIDIDGNGEYPATHVKCYFNEAQGTAMTLIEHNMKPRTEMRGEDVGDHAFPLTYRGFTPEMIEYLKEKSETCQQSVKVECYSTVLDLEHITWFKSPNRHSYIKSLGSPQVGHCPCGDTKRCIDKHSKCNCDAGQDSWNYDEGVFRGDDLPIEEVIIMQPRNSTKSSQATITVNPLQCTDKKKESKEVSFSTEASYLPIETSGSSHELKFAFRTLSFPGIVMSQTLSESTEEFNGILLDIIEDSSVAFTVAVEAQGHAEYIMKTDHKLADGDWHFVRIDYLLGNTNQARFTVDTDELVVDLPTREGFLAGTVYAGGVPLKYQGNFTGFIGCMKDIEYGGHILDFEVTAEDEGVREGCGSSCYPDLCRNGGECIERWGSYECVCVNNATQGGLHCENNLNDDALTFLTAEAYSHTIVENLTMVQDTKEILKQDIVIAFRTSNREGLILYVNDHFNNFIQLGVEPAEDDKDRVVFAFNSGQEIVEVFVEGTDFTKGKLVQVQVKRTSDVTYLIVDDVISQVEAPLMFLETYNHIPFPEHEEKVTPGRAPAQPADFIQLFIGGVDRNTQSTIDGFIGCLSGFKYGEDTLINLSTIAKTDKDPDVVEGCTAKCIDGPCLNNGICEEDFAKQTFHCDCSETFFIGESCTDDVGAHFNGNGAMIYTPAEGTEIVGVGNISIRAAFSTDVLPESEALLALYTAAEASEDYILATMKADGYINFEILQENVLYSGLSNINAADDYRHSLYISTQLNNAPVAEVDGDSVLFMRYQQPEKSVRLSYELSEPSAMDSVEADAGLSEAEEDLSPSEEEESIDKDAAEVGPLSEDQPAADEEPLPEEELMAEEESLPEEEALPNEELPVEDESFPEEEALPEGETPVEEEPFTEEETLAEEEVLPEEEPPVEDSVPEEESLNEDEVVEEDTAMSKKRKRRNVEEEDEKLSNTFHLAGSWSNDVRFVHLQMYKGCISNVAVLIRNENVRPEEAYFGYNQEEDIQVTANDENAISEGACRSEWAPPIIIPAIKPSYHRMMGSAWVSEDINKTPFTRAASESGNEGEAASSKEDNDDDKDDEEHAGSGSALIVIAVLLLIAIIVTGIFFLVKWIKTKKDDDDDDNSKKMEDIKKDPESAEPFFSGKLAREASEKREPSFAGANSTPGKYKQREDEYEPKETAPFLNRPKSQEIPTKTEANHDPFKSRPLSQEVFNTPPPSPTYGMRTSAPLGTISEVTLSQWPKDRKESMVK